MRLLNWRAACIGRPPPIRRIAILLDAVSTAGRLSASRTSAPREGRYGVVEGREQALTTLTDRTLSRIGLTRFAVGPKASSSSVCQDNCDRDTGAVCGGPHFLDT